MAADQPNFFDRLRNISVALGALSIFAPPIYRWLHLHVFAPPIRWCLFSVQIKTNTKLRNILRYIKLKTEDTTGITYVRGKDEERHYYLTTDDQKDIAILQPNNDKLDVVVGDGDGFPNFEAYFRRDTMPAQLFRVQPPLSTKTKEKSPNPLAQTLTLLTGLILFMYAGLATHCFQMLKCTEIHGVDYNIILEADSATMCHFYMVLEADPSLILCHDNGKYALYTTLSIVFIFVYIIRIPSKRWRHGLIACLSSGSFGGSGFTCTTVTVFYSSLFRQRFETLVGVCTKKLSIHH